MSGQAIGIIIGLLFLATLITVAIVGWQKGWFNGDRAIPPPSASKPPSKTTQSSTGTVDAGSGGTSSTPSSTTATTAKAPSIPQTTTQSTPSAPPPPQQTPQATPSPPQPTPQPTEAAVVPSLTAAELQVQNLRNNLNARPNCKWDENSLVHPNQKYKSSTGIKFSTIDMFACTRDGAKSDCIDSGGIWADSYNGFADHPYACIPDYEVTQQQLNTGDVACDAIQKDSKCIWKYSTTNHAAQINKSNRGFCATNDSSTCPLGVAKAECTSKEGTWGESTNGFADHPYGCVPKSFPLAPSTNCAWRTDCPTEGAFCNLGATKLKCNKVVLNGANKNLWTDSSCPVTDPATGASNGVPCSTLGKTCNGYTCVTNTNPANSKYFSEVWKMV